MVIALYTDDKTEAAYPGYKPFIVPPNGWDHERCCNLCRIQFPVVEAGFFTEPPFSLIRHIDFWTGRAFDEAGDLLLTFTEDGFDQYQQAIHVPPVTHVAVLFDTGAVVVGHLTSPLHLASGIQPQFMPRALVVKHP